jgi:hypothetical protein
MNRLLEYLESIDDSRLLLLHIQKQLEEGKFKLPTDVENQIVQDFHGEDVINAVKEMTDSHTHELQLKRQ